MRTFTKSPNNMVAPFTYSVPSGHTATFKLPGGGHWIMIDQVNYDILVLRVSSGGSVYSGWVSQTTRSNYSTANGKLICVNNTNSSFRLYFIPLNGNAVTLDSDVATP